MPREDSVHRNLLIGAGLAVLLLGVGVTVGQNLPHSADPAASGLPELLTVQPTSQPQLSSPALLEESDDDVLARLRRLEDTVAGLVRQQAAMAEALEPATELVAFLRAKVPSYTAARQDANRTAAIATLRNAVSAQAQVQATGRVDTDADGTGEFAGFREMSGATPGRMDKALVPPVLSRAFRALNSYGEVIRSGYHYRIYLPGPGGEGIGEPSAGFSSSSGVDPDLAETTWCCYAWPVDAEASGGHVFFMNQGGDTLSTVDTRYSGPGRGPAADAAFRSRGAITGAPANGVAGQDGNTWKQVN